MTRAPSAILVVRHGARLDATDRNWHFTSPAPYDPPLTYGGWNQAKALGSRIANILSKRASESNKKSERLHRTESGAVDGGNFRKRKQKVVLHTSPFLRCIQTSVAIGAGMAQSLELSEKRSKRAATRKSNEHGDTDTDAYSVKALGLETPDQINIKTMLRVDAFLGEWLSPDYFESITPPPNSTMMVAAAKANLLRKEQIEVFRPGAYGNGNFPGGWSKANMSREAPISNTTVVEDDELPLDKLSLMAPLRQQRSNSATDSGDRSGHFTHLLSSLRPTKAAYDAPIPAYAVAPSDPIPKGYCVHARDACTDLDLLWDSMRFPQDWGDGGEIGEEWSAMHRRFRKGLSKMVDWYKEHTPEFHPDREDALALQHEIHEDDDDDDDYDLTLIIVTHAAGCNALIGALTDQPVLHDFGLTSLSMAVRKDHDTAEIKPSSPVNGYATEQNGRRRSSVYVGLSEEYEMKILSSTDHLRAGVQATKAAALTSPHLVPKIPTYSSLSHSNTPSAAQEPKRSISAALGSIRRSSLSPLGPIPPEEPVSPLSGSSGTPTSAAGLWSRTSTISSPADEVPAISIGSPAISRPSSSRNDKPRIVEQGAKKTEDAVPTVAAALPSRSLSQRGLWSGQMPVRRSGKPKRRWTVTEQDEFD